MPNTICSIDGCSGKVRARGWCAAHYCRWQNHGDPHAGRPMRSQYADGLCISCGEQKSNDDFYRERGRLKRVCKTCFLAACRETQYGAKYGLTTQEFEVMFAAQGGSCKICRRQCRTGQRLSVDHCHQTGKVRGLLCRKCNSAIGNLGDDPALVRAALEYLTEEI